MARTHISWATHVWNPTVGCSKVSEGCQFCYAEKMAQRLRRMGRPEYQDVVDDKGWTGVVRCLPDRLANRFPSGARVFVDSMSDLFHEAIPDTFVSYVLDVLARRRDVTWLVLTKRPGRMRYFLSTWADWGLQPHFQKRYGTETPLDHVWFGVSVENQATADERIPLLLDTPAAVRFVSVEPCLEEMDCIQLGIWARKGIGWWIVGAESGPNRRPFRVDWAENIHVMCRATGTAFFAKQSSALRPGKPLVLPGYGVVQEWPKA